jgi:hypothetical protein
MVNPAIYDKLAEVVVMDLDEPRLGDIHQFVKGTGLLFEDLFHVGFTDRESSKRTPFLLCDAPLGRATSIGRAVRILTATLSFQNTSDDLFYHSHS